MRKILSLIIVFMTLMPAMVSAQTVDNQTESTAPKTFFPYPQAPDTIQTLENRTNYIVSKFWDNYNLSRPITDEKGFESAFQDYLDFFKYSNKTVSITSLRNFLNKIQSNAANVRIISSMAERNLYGPEALYWSDEVYTEFLKSFLGSKSLSKDLKAKYKNQMDVINKNVTGNDMPDIDVYNLDGGKEKLSSLLSEFTFVFFNSEADSSLDRIMLSTSVGLNNMIKEGKLKVICLCPDKYSKQWADEARTWADNWTIVTTPDVYKVYDIRTKPSLYIVKENKILNKNITVSALKSILNL